MALKRAEYKDVRNQMQPGDVIAFSGKGNFSEIIKWATRANVSHVGVILQSKLLINGEPQKGFFNQIIESTSLNGFSGVMISRLGDRIDLYDGEIWWLPLSDSVRQRMNLQTFYNWLLHQEHKEYDMTQAIKSALDALDKIPLIGKTTHNIEDFSKFTLRRPGGSMNPGMRSIRRWSKSPTSVLAAVAFAFLAPRPL